MHRGAHGPMKPGPARFPQRLPCDAPVEQSRLSDAGRRCGPRLCRLGHAGTDFDVVALAARRPTSAGTPTLDPYAAGHGFGQSAPVPARQSGSCCRSRTGSAAFEWRSRCDAGAVDWKVAVRQRTALCHPLASVIRRATGDELVFVNWEQGIVGVDPATGRRTWGADVFDKGARGSIDLHRRSWPVDLAIGVSGYLGHGYEAIAIDPEREGDKVVWKLDRGAPLCTTPLVVNGLVIFWADNGVVTCVDAATGPSSGANVSAAISIRHLSPPETPSTTSRPTGT